jgi:hypothetical protein
LLNKIANSLYIGLQRAEGAGEDGEQAVRFKKLLIDCGRSPTCLRSYREGEETADVFIKFLTYCVAGLQRGEGAGEGEEQAHGQEAGDTDEGRPQR